MFTLYLGKSRSANYPKAVKWIKLMGGEQKDNDWVLRIKEETKAYERLFPLFRLNAMEWKNTRAYLDGKRINPYRHALLKHKEKNVFIAEVLEQLDWGSFDALDLVEEVLYDIFGPVPFLYNKREGNRFYFKGTEHEFYIDLKGKELYDFVDKFDIGDVVFFE